MSNFYQKTGHVAKSVHFLAALKAMSYIIIAYHYIFIVYQ